MLWSYHQSGRRYSHPSNRTHQIALSHTCVTRLTNHQPQEPPMKSTRQPLSGMANSLLTHHRVGHRR